MTLPELCVFQRGLWSGGGGGEAGGPHRVSETTQHLAEQEAAQPIGPALIQGPLVPAVRPSPASLPATPVLQEPPRDQIPLLRHWIFEQMTQRRGTNKAKVERSPQMEGGDKRG